MPRTHVRELVRIPVPKGHRPRPGARITEKDRRVVAAYLACKGDVASVCHSFEMRASHVRYVLAKLGAWKRWVKIRAQLPRCEHCHRPLPRYQHRRHAACFERIQAAKATKLRKRVEKLFASGLTIREVAATIGYSVSHVSRTFSGLALTSTQRRRRGLPPARRLPRTGASTSTRPQIGDRRMGEWALVRVPLPRHQRGKPPRQMTTDERAAVKAYLECEGDIASAARAHGMSSDKLRRLVLEAHVGKRWMRRRIPPSTCAACGRPLRRHAHDRLHRACQRRQEAAVVGAWVARAKELFAKGWTLERVAERVGYSMKYVSKRLPGHARALKHRQAAADAKLRKFARLVKKGSSQRDAARRLAYNPKSSAPLAWLARKRGYL